MSKYCLTSRAGPGYRISVVTFWVTFSLLWFYVLLLFSSGPDLWVPLTLNTPSTNFQFSSLQVASQWPKCLKYLKKWISSGGSSSWMSKRYFWSRSWLWNKQHPRTVSEANKSLCVLGKTPEAELMVVLGYQGAVDMARYSTGPQCLGWHLWSHTYGGNQTILDFRKVIGYI